MCMLETMVVTVRDLAGIYLARLLGCEAVSTHKIQHIQCWC